MSRFLEDVEDTTEFDQIDSGNIWRDEVEMRFKLRHLDLMKKMGYNWNEKEYKIFRTRWRKPKAKFKYTKQALDCTLPNKGAQNKDVKFTKPKAAEDN